MLGLFKDELFPNKLLGLVDELLALNVVIAVTSSDSIAAKYNISAFPSIVCVNLQVKSLEWAKFLGNLINPKALAEFVEDMSHPLLGTQKTYSKGLNQFTNRAVAYFFIDSKNKTKYSAAIGVLRKVGSKFRSKIRLVKISSYLLVLLFLFLFRNEDNFLLETNEKTQGISIFAPKGENAARFSFFGEISESSISKFFFDWSKNLLTSISKDALKIPKDFNRFLRTIVSENMFAVTYSHEILIFFWKTNSKNHDWVHELMFKLWQKNIIPEFEVLLVYILLILAFGLELMTY